MAKGSRVLARLEEIRKDSGTSRKELAAQVGKTRQAIDAAFRGQSNLPIDAIERLAVFLGARVDVILPGDPVADVERALAADPELKPHTREVILAAYRRGRIGDATTAHRPKVRAASSSR